MTDLPDPTPGDGELVVAVEACGICGTDLHILEGRSYRPALPFVMGHEPVGRVIEVGDGVPPEDWLDRRVTLTLFEGCGRCSLCASGDERLCPDLVAITGVLRTPGGFAERLVIRVSQAVLVPPALAPDAAASLVDAGATAANSVRTAQVAPEGPAVIVGGGPVGFFVAELYRVAGRDHVVVQPSAPRREALAALGHPVAAGLAEVAWTPSVVIDCAGAPEALPWALDRLRSHGCFVAAGYGLVEHVDLAPCARKELVVTGVRSGRREDLVRMLDLAASGVITLPPLTRWPLEQINLALRALRERRVPGKALITMPA